MKFMQSLEPRIIKQLKLLSKKRGITIQEYIRAVIIPEYLSNHPISTSKKRSDAIKKSWDTRRLKKLYKNNAATTESSDEFTALITPPPWETQTEPKEGDQS